MWATWIFPHMEGQRAYLPHIFLSLLFVPSHPFGEAFV